MDSLQVERAQMTAAESKIDKALTAGNPAKATSEILRYFAELPSYADKQAFVSVLASRVAVASYLTGLRGCQKDPSPHD